MIKKLKFIIPLIIGVLLFASTSFAGLNRVKTWIDVEVLTHTDLNGEINNIIDNALTLISPLLGNLDFNNKEALNFVLEKLSTDGTGVEGQVIYNTTDDHLKLKNDSAWVFVLDAPTLGTSGQFLTTNGTDLSWASAHQSSTATNASSLTTTSTSFTDITGMSITLTTGANRVLVGFTGVSYNDTAASITYFDVTVDNTTETSSLGVISITQPAGSGSYRWNSSFTFLSSTLTAASHTFKIQWKVSSDTSTLRGDVLPTRMWVVELK